MPEDPGGARARLDGAPRRARDGRVLGDVGQRRRGLCAAVERGETRSRRRVVERGHDDVVVTILPPSLVRCAGPAAPRALVGPHILFQPSPLHAFPLAY